MSQEAMKVLPLEEYERLVKHNQTLNAAIKQLEGVIVAMVLEQNTERVTINRRALVRAPDFKLSVRHFVKRVEVSAIHRSVLMTDAPSDIE